MESFIFLFRVIGARTESGRLENQGLDSVVAESQPLLAFAYGFALIGFDTEVLARK
jgi:hypothetical protein